MSKKDKKNVLADFQIFFFETKNIIVGFPLNVVTLHDGAINSILVFAHHNAAELMHALR